MMCDARYAQKRHTSYLQAHTDAIILFLLKNERNRLILTQIVIILTQMAATCYCSLSVIVFKEHQSHRTLPCFDL